MNNPSTHIPEDQIPIFDEEWYKELSQHFETILKHKAEHGYKVIDRTLWPEPKPLIICNGY